MCLRAKKEENVNMLFVMSDMLSIQNLRTDHVVVSYRSSLVSMSYATCRFVLTCGGVPQIIWEVHSGLIGGKVVLSVRGCLIREISE